MPEVQLSAGRSVQFSAPPGAFVVVCGAGEATIGGNATGARRMTLRSNAQTTPLLAAGANVQINATGDAWYQLVLHGEVLSEADLPDIAPPGAMVSVDGAPRYWNAGWGQAFTAADVGALRAASPQRYAVGLGLFGDSIASNGYYSSVTEYPQWFPPAALDNYERSWGWATSVGPLSMQRITVVKNFAVQTNGLLVPGTAPTGYPLSAQVTAALADPLWPSVTRATIVVGTNDATVTKADSTYATISQCAAELLTQISRLGKPVTLISSPPRGGTVTTVVGDSVAIWAWLQEWRATLKRIADASKGWISFVDGYTLGNSPTTTPDVIQSGSTYDNIHPNNVYAYRIADAFVSSILPTGVAGDIDIWPNASFAGSTNAALLDQGFANPTFATASGGTAGSGVTLGAGAIAGSLTLTGIGTGTIASGGATVAATTIPGGVGNMQSMAITSGAAGDGIDVTTATAHAAGGTFLNPGDAAWAQMLVRVNSGGIYPRNMFFRLQGIAGSTYNRLLWEANGSNEKALPLTASKTYLLRTPLFVAPPTALSALVVKFRPIFDAAGAGSIDIGNLEIRRFRSGGVYS